MRSLPGFGQQKCTSKLSKLFKGLRTIWKSPWYNKSHVIDKNLEVDTIKKTIKNCASKIFEKLYAILNDVFFEISDYEVQGGSKRPRVALYLPEGIKP